MRDAKRIGINSIFLLSLTISNYFIGLLLFPFISRSLSVGGFGVVSFGMAFSIIFQTIIEYGFMISATAKIAKNKEDKDEVSRLVSIVTFSKLLLSAFALFIFAVLFFTFNDVRQNALLMFLFFMSAAVSSFLPDFYFRGIEEMRSIAVRSITTKLLSILAIVLFVKGDSEIHFIPSFLLAGNMAGLAYAYYEMLNKGVSLKKVAWDDVIEEIRAGFFNFISRVSVSLNGSLGLLFLGNRYSASSYEVGIFSAATRISTAGEMLVIPVSDSLYPHMIRKKDYGLFRKIYLSGLIIWAAGCLFVYANAEVICELILGKAYLESAELLRILLIGTFFSFSSNLFGYNALAPLGLIRHANAALILSFLINLSIMSWLSYTGSLTLVSVAWVLAMSNLFVFLYRATFLFLNKDLLINKVRSNE